VPFYGIKDSIIINIPSVTGLMIIFFCNLVIKAMLPSFSFFFFFFYIPHNRGMGDLN
jgi:hypothetical protein